MGISYPVVVVAVWLCHFLFDKKRNWVRKIDKERGCYAYLVIYVAFSIKYSSYSNDNNKTVFYWINLHMNVTAANAIAK